MGVTISPSSASFGPTPVGTQVVQLFVVSNTTGQSVDISVETGTEFSILGSANCIAAHTTEEFYVQYESAAEGSHTDALVVTRSNPSGAEAARADLNGTTTASLQISTTAMDFGDVLVGSSSVSALLVTNSTGATVTLSLGSGDFTITPTSIESLGIPMQVMVTYEPSAVGASTQVTLTASTLSCTLDGTGIEEQDTAALAAAAAAQTTANSAQTTANSAQTTANSAQTTANANAATLSYVESGATPEAGDGAATRMKVEVPTENTLFYLGRGTTTTDVQNYIDGCGLQTDANVYLRAKNGHIYGKAGGNIHLWSEGGTNDNPKTATLHSNGSKSKTVISSAGMAYLTGEGGAIVNGGLDFGWSGTGKDKQPDTSNIDTWATIFTSVDVVLGAALALDAISSTAKDWKKSGKVKRFVELAGTAGAIGAPIFGGLGAGGVLPGVTIFGQMAVSIFSPFYTAIYGVAGLGLVSAYPTVIGIVDATVWAGDDVSITAFKGDLNLEAGDAISINSCDPAGGGSVSIHATAPAHAIGGTISLHGNEVLIGNQLLKPPPEGYPMTNQVVIEGSVFKVDVLSQISLKVGLAELTMDLDGTITLKGGANELKMSPTGGIEVTGPTGMKFDTSPTSLELLTTGATLKNAGAEVSVSPTEAKIKQGASEVGVTAANITAKGNWAFN